MKKIVFILIISALTITLGACKQDQNQLSKEVIKIGFVAPLSGDTAVYGLDEKKATDMAVEEINSRGGIKGRFLQIIYEDGGCDGKQGANAAQKLINIDKVKIILGGACSGETLGMLPITEQNNVIVFSSFATNPAVTKAGQFIFRNIPPDDVLAAGVADLIQRDGYRRVALLSENTDYGVGLRDAAIKKLKALNLQVVADELYAKEAKDFMGQLTKIQQAQPEAIIFNPQSGTTGGLAVKQARELGIEAQFYGMILFGGEDTLKAGGSALNGFKFTDYPGLGKDNPKAQRFLTDFSDQYTKSVGDFEVAARYDSVFILKQAIESCGDVNTECIRDYLYNMPDYDGVIGKYHFDQNGDPVGFKTFTVKQIVDAEKGEIVEIE